LDNDEDYFTGQSFHPVEKPGRCFAAVKG